MPAPLPAVDTCFICPPIPVRDFDWQATLADRDPDDGPAGFGATEEEAIADLRSQIEEDA